MSHKTLLLTQSQIRSLVSVEVALPAVEGAFEAQAKGDALMPSKVYLTLPEPYNGDFRAMPSYLRGSAGIKWVNSHADNPRKHQVPAVMALYVLSDPETALPLAVMDATLITAIRTGAAGGVASKFLAKKQPRSIGFVGCGVQAHYLLAAHRAIFSNLEILAADVSNERATAFASEVKGRAVSVEEACRSDIVCTATPSRVPVVKRTWIGPGTHINAMGADAPGKQELDPQILLDGIVIVDEMDQATHSGELNVPIERGEYSESQVRATLGQVITGQASPRKGEEITVFDSTGLALQDVALARVAYDEAKRRGVGAEVDFLS